MHYAMRFTLKTKGWMLDNGWNFRGLLPRTQRRPVCRWWSLKHLHGAAKNVLGVCNARCSIGLTPSITHRSYATPVQCVSLALRGVFPKILVPNLRVLVTIEIWGTVVVGKNPEENIL